MLKIVSIFGVKIQIRDKVKKKSGNDQALWKCVKLRKGLYFTDFYGHYHHDDDHQLPTRLWFVQQ